MRPAVVLCAWTAIVLAQNPASSQSADSGTWTATEGTLTTHSRGGKTSTYRLEKRNHPKNVRDPMIVLDGQTFVTAYSKPPW